MENHFNDKINRNALSAYIKPEVQAILWDVAQAENRSKSAIIEKAILYYAEMLHNMKSPKNYD
jgi:predicted transcriptional regulator